VIGCFAGSVNIARTSIPRSTSAAGSSSAPDRGSYAGRFVAIGMKNEPQPAKDWPNYPNGWQDAQAVAQAHGEEQGFWRESK
jgi:hypothetical protein